MRVDVVTQFEKRVPFFVDDSLRSDLEIGHGLSVSAPGRLALMSYVVMNVITVPEDRREEFERRFATRAGKIKEQDGFEAFELMRPDDGKDRYVVYTRWESKAAFEAWMGSPDFAAGHRQHAEGGPVGTASELLLFELIEGEYRPG